MALFLFSQFTPVYGLYPSGPALGEKVCFYYVFKFYTGGAPYFTFPAGPLI